MGRWIPNTPLALHMTSIAVVGPRIATRRWASCLALVTGRGASNPTVAAGKGASHSTLVARRKASHLVLLVQLLGLNPHVRPSHGL